MRSNHTKHFKTGSLTPVAASLACGLQKDSQIGSKKQSMRNERTQTPQNMKSIKVTSISVVSFFLMNASLRADDAALASSLQTQTEAKAALDASAAAQAEAAAKAAAEAAAKAAASANASAEVKADAQASGSSSGEASGAGFGEVNSDGKIGLGVVSNLESATEITTGADLGAALKVVMGDEKPQRPDHSTLGAELSAEVRAMIDTLNAQRDTLLAARAQLLVQMRTSATTQREQLRDSVKTQRETWLDARQSLLVDTKARLAEIRAEFKNSTDVEAVITAAKEEGRHRRN
jgi:hypothetical protein